MLKLVKTAHAYLLFVYSHCTAVYNWGGTNEVIKNKINGSGPQDWNRYSILLCTVGWSGEFFFDRTEQVK